MFITTLKRIRNKRVIQPDEGKGEKDEIESWFLFSGRQRNRA